MKPVTPADVWLAYLLGAVWVAFGAFLALRPKLMIALIHRGEESSPYTQWMLGRWWNRWASYSPAVIGSGILLVLLGLYWLLAWTKHLPL